jgi:hypothetical protein
MFQYSTFNVDFSHVKSRQSAVRIRKELSAELWVTQLMFTVQMARRSRRSVRPNTQKSPEPSNVSTPSSHSPSKLDTTEAAFSHAEEEVCPACKGNTEQELDNVNKENWVRCDACKTWFHWRCAGDNGDLEVIDKWSVLYTSVPNFGMFIYDTRFCKPCLEADPSRVITIKPPTRKSSRKRTQRDYANLNVGLESDPNKWTRILQEKAIKDAGFKRMNGADLGLEWLENDDTAMREPVVVESPDGLGMKMPAKSLTVDDVAELVGQDTPIEVMGIYNHCAIVPLLKILQN